MSDFLFEWLFGSAVTVAVALPMVFLLGAPLWAGIGIGVVLAALVMQESA